MSRHTCKGCKFWDVVDPVENDRVVQGGRCRRNAPRIGDNDEPLGSVWPRTYADDWCGDFHIRDGVGFV